MSCEGGPAILGDPIGRPCRLEDPLHGAFRDAFQVGDLPLNVLLDHVQCGASGEGRKQDDVGPIIIVDAHILHESEFDDAAGQFRIGNAVEDRTYRIDVPVAAHHAAPGSADRTAVSSACAAVK